MLGMEISNRIVADLRSVSGFDSTPMVHVLLRESIRPRGSVHRHDGLAWVLLDLVAESGRRPGGAAS